MSKDTAIIGSDPDPLAKTRPLADPLRFLTWYFVGNGFFLWFLFSLLTYYQFGSVGDGWEIGLGLACVQWGGAILIAPFRKTNAIYLRAFKTDSETAKLRLKLAAILGPDFRLSGIRPPRKKNSPLTRLLLTGMVAFRYAGSKYMDLEAGDDWMARLWRTYQQTRLVFVDVRALTARVHREIQMTLESLGVERCVFIVGEGHTDAEWRAIIADVAGEAIDPANLKLLDTSPERVKQGRMKEDLRAILRALPAGVPGKSERGRAFVLANVTPEELRKGRRTWPRIVAAVVAALVIIFITVWLLPKLPEGSRDLILGPLSYAALFLVLAAIFRALARAVRMARAGHAEALVTGIVGLVASTALLAAGTAAVAGGIGDYAQDLSRIQSLPTPQQVTGEVQAMEELNLLWNTELYYAALYPDQGYACSFAALGGNSASGPPSSQAAQLISPDLATGKLGGYVYSFSYCIQEKGKNGVMKGMAYGILAQPTSSVVGRCSFSIDERGEHFMRPVNGSPCNWAWGIN